MEGEIGGGTVGMCSFSLFEVVTPIDGIIVVVVVVRAT